MLDAFSIEPHGAMQFGAGTSSSLAAGVLSLGHRRAFIVTDPGVAGAGIPNELQQQLTFAGIESRIFQDIQPNPGVETLNAGGRAIRDFGIGVVVAVGGGAVLDVAKALALMAVNPGSGRAFDYNRTFSQEGLPVVALPTTSGTGSETNAWGVIDDHEAGRKFYVGHRSVAPRLIILDPDLTRGLPPGPTAASGMDALTHALESLSSVRNNPYAEALNLQVVQMVTRYLRRAVEDGQDLEARSQLLLAAYLAGLAFATTGLGMAHGLGHALSARVGAPHGVALAVLLPHVLAYNLPVRRDTYKRLVRTLGDEYRNTDTDTSPESIIDTIRRLSIEVGMPESLASLGLSEAQIPVIVADALADEVLANTPRRPTDAELESLLQQAI